MRKPLLVMEFLDRAWWHYGDEEAVVATTGERFTYDRLGERVDGFSAALQSRGVERGDHVAVSNPNTHYHLEAAYGPVQLGAVRMPLNYRLVPADFEYVLNDADVTAVYADYAFVEKIDAIRDEISAEIFVTNDPEKTAESIDGEWLDFDELVAESTDYECPEMDEDDIIIINYTSGTTGDPRDVCRTHRIETIHAYLVSMHQNIGDDDMYLWALPTFHVNSWGHIYAITGHGAKHVCTRGVEAEAVLDTIRDEDVLYLYAAPTVLNILMKHYHKEGGVEMTGANPVRAATTGTVPPEATIRTVEDEFDWRLMHVYGVTETGPFITTSEAGRYLTGGDDRFGVKKRQGTGYLGIDVRVVDEDGIDVPRDEQPVGEIVVMGNQVMEKYWNKPEKAEGAFSARLEGYYHMGDLAVVDENDFISIQDRKKDIIIPGDENISSTEPEDTLLDHDEIADVTVIPVLSGGWDESPKAFVVSTSSDPDAPGATVEALITFYQERIATYKMPKEVGLVTELPKTATGKVQKCELCEREWEDEGRMMGEG